MYVDSEYKKMLESIEDVKNNGYEYGKEGMTKHFFSNRVFQNPKMAGFLEYVNSMLIELTESVKKIQFYTNYTIDKNDRRLNQ